ncbi:hypothetical protein [Undibacterium sp. Ren11W]|uniref:hypothetical protein n=1 Tax=Undibacterium sp. Ren11W TaxID=3413045 RepID=UPI003BF4454F
MKAVVFYTVLALGLVGCDKAQETSVKEPLALPWSKQEAWNHAGSALFQIEHGEKALIASLNGTDVEKDISTNITRPLVQILRKWRAQWNELKNENVEIYSQCHFALLDFQRYSFSFTDTETKDLRQQRDVWLKAYKEELKQCRVSVLQSKAQENKSEPEYQPETFEAVKDLAMKGNYQAQRNLAFGYVSDAYKGQDKNPIVGCAWYKLIIKSGNEKVNNTDVNNVKVYCDSLSPLELEVANAQSIVLYKKVYPQ